MNAAEVREALTRRWPEDRYLHIAEATIDPWRMGSKIDVAVIACWKSLGWAIDAVEVKVSLSDFKKEIERYYWTVEGDDRRYTDRRQAHSSRFGRTLPDGSMCSNPEMADTHWPITRHTEPCLHKSEVWRQIAHRFWIACPAPLATKIEKLLPDGWGLLAVDGRGTTVVVKPERNPEPRRLNWSESVALLRCAVDASQTVRGRTFERGAKAGYRQAQIDLLSPDADPVEMTPTRLRFLPGHP